MQEYLKLIQEFISVRPCNILIYVIICGANIVETAGPNHIQLYKYNYKYIIIIFVYIL